MQPDLGEGFGSMQRKEKRMNENVSFKAGHKAQAVAQPTSSTSSLKCVLGEIYQFISILLYFFPIPFKCFYVTRGSSSNCYWS